MIQTGKFPLQEKSFILNGRKAVIKQRKEKKGKPELYLIELQPFEYISSLFPTTDSGVYTFDKDNELFKLKLEECQVEIMKA